MRIRSFEKKRLFTVLAVLALSVLSWLGVHKAMAGPEAAPPAALYAITWRSALITTDTNSTAYLTQNYAYHDVFCAVDALDAQTVTITVQSSPDNSTFYDTYEFSQIVTDTDVYTRLVSYGRYERLEFDVRTSAAITPACKSVFFNNWTPAAYCNAKQ